jgi:hypothetical protein
MRILSGGNVGIGCTNPANKMNIQVATDHRIGFWGDTNYSAIQSVNDANSVLKKLRFDSSEYHIMSGNVGINETSPNAKLDVDGDIQIEGANALLLNHTTGGASDTYINSPESNKIAFRTGGVERFYVDLNGTFVIKESTGDPDSTKAYLQSTKTYTDDEYENFDMAGRGAMVIVACTTGSNERSALFFMDYASITVVKVADPSNDFANSDTDDKICCYKSSGNSGTFQVKNRKGGDRAISVGIVSAGA